MKGRNVVMIQFYNTYGNSVVLLILECVTFIQYMGKGLLGHSKINLFYFLTIQFNPIRVETVNRHSVYWVVEIKILVITILPLLNIKRN